jgi:hypothetical protein
VRITPLSAVLVGLESLRQVFNDADAEALWLVVGAPPQAANTLEMTRRRQAGSVGAPTA